MTSEVKSKQHSRHNFVPRTSYLDSYHLDESHLQNSIFKGFYRLIIVFGLFHVLLKPIHNYHIYGYFFKSSLISKLITDLEILISVYPIFYAWSYLAFLLQILIKKNIIISNHTILLFQHSTQLGVFILALIYCLWSSMCITHMAFVVVQCIIHFFKMHSYTQVNKSYRAEYMSGKYEKSDGKYPQNINISNFLYFIHCPTFIYQDNYPKSESIRWKYVIHKSCLAFAALICLYHLYTEYLEPVVVSIPTTPFPILFINVFIPMSMFSLLTFFLIFEIILNAYAEIMRFADREFYQDWWNSTDFEEFNRKWNKPVHQFLYQHVYLEYHYDMGYSKTFAKTITFLFSAALHEFAIIIIMRFIYPFMTLLMVIQIPVIQYTKKYFKGTIFGNYFFWISTNTGLCLIFLVYNKEYIERFGV